MLTKAEYISLMEHAIGGSSPATGHTLDATFQRAGRSVFEKYPWPWLQVDTTPAGETITLAAVAGVPSIDLPLDFLQVVSLVDPSNIWTRVEWSTPEKVIDRRRWPILANVYLVSVLGLTPRPTTTTTARPKLLLDRTPTTDGSPTFALAYRRQWVDLANDADVPDMPPDMEEALIRLCRARAWSLENDDEHPDEGRAQAEMRERWKTYARMQPILGRPRGGAGDRVGRWTGRRAGFDPGQIVF